MSTYLTTTYTPAMQGNGIPCLGITEITEDTFKAELSNAAKGQLVIAVGHENTAKILSGKLGITIPMNRVSITLKKNDILLCTIPQFRAPSGAREFTDEEIAESKFRYFFVEC